MLALRGRVIAATDAQLREIAATVTITLTNGTVLTQHVEKVIGSAENPMSDGDLEAKVHGLAHGILPEAKTAALIALTWRVAELTDMAEFARGAAGE